MSIPPRFAAIFCIIKVNAIYLRFPVVESTKNPSGKSAIFRGCPVLSGNAEIEVFAVGDSSLLGQISKEVQLDTRESPLKLRLTKLAKQISTLGYIAAVLVALATLFNTFVIDSGFRSEVILMNNE